MVLSSGNSKKEAVHHLSDIKTYEFLKRWEELYILGKINSFCDKMGWYGMFIDELLLIGQGDEESFTKFHSHVIQNYLYFSFPQIHLNILLISWMFLFLAMF